MGKEGPMIHSGAVVGAGLPQVRAAGLRGHSPQQGPPGRAVSMVEFATHPLGASNMALEADVRLGGCETVPSPSREGQLVPLGFNKALPRTQSSDGT